jgi:pimeloyl-ACP methyl ester carboxylesterase
MSYFEKNSIQFYYEEIGEGKPLLFLHGMGGDIEQPKGLLNQLDNVHLIVVDQRAHGKSVMETDGKFTFEEMADDIISLANHLNIEQFSLGGISMGASVAANIAYRYPKRVDKLFLVRAAWGKVSMEADIILWYQTLAHFLQEKSLEGYQKSKIFQTIQNKAPEAVDSFLKAFNDPMAITNYQKFEVIPQQCPYKDIENLGKITAETIVLSNQKDYIHKYKYGKLYMKYLKNAVFHEIVPKCISASGYKTDLNAYISYYMKLGHVL